MYLWLVMECDEFDLQFIAGPVSEDESMAPVHLPLCVTEEVKPAIKSNCCLSVKQIALCCKIFFREEDCTIRSQGLNMCL